MARYTGRCSATLSSLSLSLSVVVEAIDLEDISRFVAGDGCGVTTLKHFAIFLLLGIRHAEDNMAMMQSAQDVPLQIISDNSSSERRISPSWSLSDLKTRLEPITGIPSSSQQIELRCKGQASVALEAADEDATRLSNFPLVAYAELHVSKCLVELLLFDSLRHICPQEDCTSQCKSIGSICLAMNG